DDGNARPRGDVQVDVAECFAVGGVAEVEVTELNLALDALVGQSGDGIVVVDRGGLLHDRVDAHYGSRSALYQVDDPAYGDHRPDQLHHVHVVAGELADGEVVLHHFMASDQQRNHQRDAEHKLQGGPQHRHQARQQKAAANVLLVGALEGGNLRLLLRKGADQPRAGEVLFGLCGDVREHGLDAFEARMNARAEVLHQH